MLYDYIPETEVERKAKAFFCYLRNGMNFKDKISGIIHLNKGFIYFENNLKYLSLQSTFPFTLKVTSIANDGK